LIFCADTSKYLKTLLKTPIKHLQNTYKTPINPPSYCDALVDTLLALLRSPATDQDARPAVLSCLGDIAFAIGGEFDP
jgi:hypothetical protein